MGIRCNKCGHVHEGKDSLHLVTKCAKCGNTERDQFIRVDDRDIDEAKHARDREWLESHKAT
jgi:predicted  nucleic acid-binding Zn-ribbon protein